MMLRQILLYSHHHIRTILFHVVSMSRVVTVGNVVILDIIPARFSTSWVFSRSWELYLRSTSGTPPEQKQYLEKDGRELG